MPTDVNALAFDEIRTLLDGKRLNKVFKQEIGNLAIQVDALIRHRVFEVYKVDQNKLKSISSVGSNRGAVETLGERVFKTSILYRHKPTALSPFQVEERWGNINTASKEGLMEFVSIKRGRGNIVSKGYEHRGGFIPRQKTKIGWDAKTGNYYSIDKQSEFLNRNSDVIRRRNLYERKGASRLSKLRLLFAPSPAQMAGYLINNDFKLIEQIAVANNIMVDKALELFYKGK
jgi:hypothetical protein